ncbi:GGDEF domain-containing protein [Sphingopyxis fribergensis]
MNERVVAAQADALFSTIVASAVTGFAGAVLIATTMLGTPAEAGAEIFVAVTALILGVRLVVRALYRKHGHDRPERWLRGATALILVSGIIWGSMMFWATRMADDPQLLVATAITLGAVMITVTSASYWPAHLAFHVPASILAAAGFLSSGRAGHLQIGIATIILCGAMSLAGRRLGAEIMRSMRLSAENAGLVAQLQKQTVELSQANDDLEQLSRTDALTGLANRRSFAEGLELHWAMSVRLRRPIALLVIDVDRFKNYNDSFGHAAGDLCLQVVADVLASSARGATDVAARLGGEEFALILPETNEDTAALVAERIRTTVESFTLEPTADLPHPVTVSVGVAAMNPADGQLAQTLVEEADRALYQAKEAGRNRVVTAG